MKKLLGLMGLLLVCAVFVTPVFAANTFGDMGTNAGANATGLASAAKNIAFLIGFVMVIGSIITFIQNKKTNQPVGIAAFTFLAGVMLVSVLALISVGSESLFGGDESAGATTDLGL